MPAGPSPVSNHLGMSHSYITLRSRKVKCNRLPGQDKVISNSSSRETTAFTSRSSYSVRHLIQQATSEKKRNASVSRRPRNNSSAAAAKYSVLDPSGKPSVVLGRFAEPPSPSGSSPAALTVSSSILDNGAAMAPPPIPNTQNLPLAVKYGFRPHITLATPTRELLSYIFAPPEQPEHQHPFSPVPGRSSSHYDVWGAHAFRLEDDNFKAEFTLDLVEVFFQIVHTRLPLLNPAHFRDRLQLNPSTSSTAGDPLHPALVATVLAWGTKFSEHPLLVADRNRPGHQSLLAKTLIDRARDLAEALKVHRIPKSDHVVISLLIEPLQSPDPEARAMMVFAWWMACFCDAYASAYYRRKPVLDDEDYDIDFYTADPVVPGDQDGAPLTSPREQLEFLGYYGAAHSLARTARSMSRQLWKPVTDSQGIPLETLWEFTTALSEWRDKYLSSVGVPSNFKGEWDFVSAVSSCASDATYHVMWIILFNALDDFGVKEINNRSVEPNNPRIEEVRRKVLEEALHGALRISGLAQVLTTNGYLVSPPKPFFSPPTPLRSHLAVCIDAHSRTRLDPAVMHVSCIQAGTLLARMGNEGVKACISGLEQYSYSYEEAGEQAIEMQRVYQQALAGEPQFSHMGRTLPTRTTPEAAASGDDQEMEDVSVKQQQPHHQHAGWAR
ncbi:hypothetical protein H0H87_006581 [Tephrocybe sp. NHM501043]|nr:hypothetical protein H0H87_006581 [Tephrocybe sp. NHM501043]